MRLTLGRVERFQALEISGSFESWTKFKIPFQTCKMKAYYGAGLPKPINESSLRNLFQ